MMVLLSTCWDKKLNNLGNWCMRQTKCCVYKGKADWLAGFKHINIHIFSVLRMDF